MHAEKFVHTFVLNSTTVQHSFFPISQCEQEQLLRGVSLVCDEPSLGEHLANTPIKRMILE